MPNFSFMMGINAGTAIQWLRDGLGLIKTSAEIDGLAGSVPDSGGVYAVPCFTGLGAPFWDPRARGTIFGISRGTTAAHLARAILESIAFRAADVLRAMEADSGIRLAELRVDGGVVASSLVMQFQADLLQIPVLRPKTHELTALGAAFLAGLATGIWKNTEEIAAVWQLDKEFRPHMDAVKRDAALEKWNQAIERTKGWEM